MTIARTPEEGKLLSALMHARASVVGLERRLHVAARASDRERAVLADYLTEARAALARAEERVASLQAQLSTALGQVPATQPRPLIDPWAPWLVTLGLLGVVAALFARRMRQKVRVPDTPEELLREDTRT